MLIGVPASGKSTWVQKHVKENPHTGVLSTDSIIEHMAAAKGSNYDESWKALFKFAEKTMYIHLKQYLNKNMDVIWDQTNMTSKSRGKKLIMIPDHYEKIAVVFSNPSDEELKRRLVSRPNKTIPWNVIEMMKKSYEAPTHQEFDRIEYVTN